MGWLILTSSPNVTSAFSTRTWRHKATLFANGLHVATRRMALQFALFLHLVSFAAIAIASARETTATQCSTTCRPHTLRTIG